MVLLKYAILKSTKVMLNMDPPEPMLLAYTCKRSLNNSNVLCVYYIELFDTYNSIYVIITLS